MNTPLMPTLKDMEVKEKMKQESQAAESTPTEQAATPTEKLKAKKNQPVKVKAAPEATLATVVLLLWLLFLYVQHCTWVTSNAYSSPSVVLATTVSGGLVLLTSP